MSKNAEDDLVKSGMLCYHVRLRRSRNYPHLPKKAAGQNVNLKGSPPTLRSCVDLVVDDHRTKQIKEALPFWAISGTTIRALVTVGEGATIFVTLRNLGIKEFSQKYQTFKEL